MRPPILQWKVMLALLAVVIVGASLGSALHSPGSRATRTFYVSGLNRPQSGGWTSYVPIRTPADFPPKLRRAMCARLKAGIPRGERPGFCHKRR